MFYKIIRICLVLASLFCLIFISGIALGWIGINNILFSLQSLLITIGLFSFYKSRPIAIKNSVLKSINVLIHILSIPIGVFGAICVKSENVASSYWYWMNLALISFLSINLITILLKSNVKPLLKIIISILGLLFSALILLQMSGNYNGGQIIFYGAISFVFITVLAVLFGAEKKLN